MTTSTSELISGPWQVSNDAYHADRTAESHSTLEVFRESRPLFHRMYVEQTMPRPDPTAAMVFGSAFHCYLLEPELFERQYAVAPECDRRTKGGKAVWEGFVGGRGYGRTALTKGQWELLVAMVKGVQANPYAAELLALHGPAEDAVRFREPASGVWLKAKFDRRIGRLIVDLKTTDGVDPDSWSRTVDKWGYHRQAALYIDAAEHGLGRRYDHVHVACSTSEPHECVVYRLGEASIELGREEYLADVAALADCRQRDCWASPRAGKWNHIELPPWRFSRR